MMTVKLIVDMVMTMNMKLMMISQDDGGDADIISTMMLFDHSFSLSLSVVCQVQSQVSEDGGASDIASSAAAAGGRDRGACCAGGARGHVRGAPAGRTVRHAADGARAGLRVCAR